MPHFEESHTPWYRVKSPLNKGPEKLEPAEGSVSAGEERDGYYPGHQGLWPSMTIYDPYVFSLIRSFGDLFAVIVIHFSRVHLRGS